LNSAASTKPAGIRMMSLGQALSGGIISTPRMSLTAKGSGFFD
jgi:hypothetical protein